MVRETDKRYNNDIIADLMLVVLEYQGEMLRLRADRLVELCEYQQAEREAITKAFEKSEKRMAVIFVVLYILGWLLALLLIVLNYIGILV